MNRDEHRLAVDQLVGSFVDGLARLGCHNTSLHTFLDDDATTVTMDGLERFQGRKVMVLVVEIPETEKEAERSEAIRRFLAARKAETAGGGVPCMPT